MSDWNEPALYAIQKWIVGEKPSFSTGIHDGITCGYGDLDQNGFWEWPLPEEFWRKIPITPAERDAWEMIFADLKRRIAEYDSERDTQQERIAELEKQIQKTRDNFYAADRLNIETQKTTTVQFSSMISRYVDKCGDQQERIADLKRQCEIGDEALTMLQENHDGDIEKLKEENERLRNLLGMISGSNWTELIRLAESLGIPHEPRKDYDWIGEYETDARRTYPNRLNLICKLTGRALDAGGDDG